LGRPESRPPDGAPCLIWDDFAGLFDWFATRAFRLETLDQYAVGYEEEAMRRFLAGEPVDPGIIAPWLDRVAAVTAAGRRMERVHVVTEPLSDYLRFEMDGYRFTVAAGEDVRILPRSVARGLELPGEDFWLFDDGPVARMHYDRHGSFLGAELVEEPKVVARYCRWRDVAVQAATPYARYVAEHQDLRHPRGRPQGDGWSTHRAAGEALCAHLPGPAGRPAAADLVEVVGDAVEGAGDVVHSARARWAARPRGW
jgi:uncharacterized protein DUF6879